MQQNANAALLSILYRPVTIRGVNGRYLTNIFNRGKFEGSSRQRNDQWVIFPLADGNVVIKSLKDGNNLQITPSGDAQVFNANQQLWE